MDGTEIDAAAARSAVARDNLWELVHAKPRFSPEYHPEGFEIDVPSFEAGMSFMLASLRMEIWSG